MLLLGTVIILLTSPIFKIQFPVSAFALTVMLLAALTNFVSVVFLYRALQGGDVSVVSPIAYSYPAITTTLGILILGERVLFSEGLALIGIIAGAILVSTRFSDLRIAMDRNKVGALAPGVGSAIISTVLSGLTFLGLGIVASATNPLLPVFVLRIIGGSAGFIVGPLVGQTIRLSRYIVSPRLLVMSLLTVLGFISYNNGVASAGNSLPVVVSLAGMASAFQVGYAIAFLGEKPDPNQSLGIILLILGVFSLLYLAA